MILDGFSDANTIGSIACEYKSMKSPRLSYNPSHGLAIASIDWGCAVQIAAAAAIGSGEKYSATNAETLYVPASPAPAPL